MSQYPSGKNQIRGNGPIGTISSSVHTAVDEALLYRDREWLVSQIRVELHHNNKLPAFIEVGDANSRDAVQFGSTNYEKLYRLSQSGIGRAIPNGHSVKLYLEEKDYRTIATVPKITNPEQAISMLLRYLQNPRYGAYIGSDDSVKLTCCSSLNYLFSDENDRVGEAIWFLKRSDVLKIDDFDIDHVRDSAQGDYHIFSLHNTALTALGLDPKECREHITERWTKTRTGANLKSNRDIEE